MESRGNRPVSTLRSAIEGGVAGVMAGSVFAVARVIAAVAMHQSPLRPFRLFASIVFGRDVFYQINFGLVFVLGALLLFTLSFGYGLIYGMLETQFAEVRRNALVHAAIGACYGLAIWFVNYRLIAPGAYPWFRFDPEPLMALLHIFCFGVPLGLFYAAERYGDTVTEEHALPTST